MRGCTCSMNPFRSGSAWNPKTPSVQGHHGELYKVHDGNLPKKSIENPSDNPLLFHDVPNLPPTRLAEIKLSM